MPPADFHLAQVNVTRARGQPDEPVMAEFMAALPEINALAERSPGFVWRLLRAKVLDERGNLSTEGQREDGLDIALGPRAARMSHLGLELGDDIGAGEVAAIELSLHPRDASAPAVGSLGVLIRGATKDRE